tara:strand:- start:210 stop:677 length:468 start_codon:yes stop_codon:yes gene_type:complete
MILKYLRIIIFFPLLLSCGFKIINENQLRNFDIVNISSTGDNRINFLLKNNLKDDKEKFNKKIKLSLETEKLKEIKEKNIKNEITKYSINIKVKVDYSLEGNPKKGSFIVSKNGNYNVASQYSQTINNEKNLITSLTSLIEEDIVNNLIALINDL